MFEADGMAPVRQKRILEDVPEDAEAGTFSLLPFKQTVHEAYAGVW